MLGILECFGFCVLWRGLAGILEGFWEFRIKDLGSLVCKRVFFVGWVSIRIYFVVIFFLKIELVKEIVFSYLRCSWIFSCFDFLSLK